jgi:hypothetical protein
MRVGIKTIRRTNMIVGKGMGGKEGGNDTKVQKG